MVYLDYNASAPFPSEWPELSLDKIGALLRDSSANPSSLHRPGRKGRKIINQTTDLVANFLNVDAEFLYWTSGASEANSFALNSAYEFALSRRRQNPVFFISAIEHESTLMAARAYEKKGVTIVTIPVDQDGVLKTEDLRTLLEQYTISHGGVDLVSVLYANNETGVIQPYRKVGSLCKKFNVPFHMDCVQGLGKRLLSIKGLQSEQDGPTYLTFSAHKIGGLKGLGFLVVQPFSVGQGKLLSAIVHGKQQKSLRGGTENPFLIGIFGEVLKAISSGKSIFPEHLETWRRDFEAELTSRIPDTIIYGRAVNRICNTTYVGFPGAIDDSILVNLDLEGICASSGSACTSGSIDPSHVLLAQGYDKDLARSSVRFSSGYGNTWADFENVLDVLPKIVERVRAKKE
ncbi:MAG: cysteine desulfurase family protein [Bacteriovoracia bacterium]